MNFSRSLLLSCAVLTLSACGSVLFNPPKNTVAQVIPPKTFKVDPALLGSPMQNYYANNQAQTVPLGQPIPAGYMVIPAGQPVPPGYVAIAPVAAYPTYPVTATSADLPMLPASASASPEAVARERQLPVIVQPLPAVPDEADKKANLDYDGQEAVAPADEDASWWDVIWSMITPSPEKPAAADSSGDD